MKNKAALYLLFLLFLLPGLLPAQERVSERVYELEKITVSGRRTLTNIGTQKTELDSMVIRDNITKSLADVLSQSSTIFIKSYGRGTLSTASFRGTAPSHTQVMWNGMKLNSPMLGMVDFSLIPSYFIDEVTLYHGASSTGITGGGLGGAITLGNRALPDEGFGLRYVQGISSWDTYDQFLRLTWGGKKFRAATRVFYTDSENDFSYTNYRKKNYIYNDAGEITGFYYPEEKNKNGSFRDFHVQQELYYKSAQGDDFTLAAWYMDSRRGIPMLDVNYREESQTENRQDDRTLRAVAGWEHRADSYKLSAAAGYAYTDLQYIYLGDSGKEKRDTMILSRSYGHTAFGKFGADYYGGKKWLLSGNVAFNQYMVKSSDRAILTQGGERSIVGYDQARTEVSAFGSVRYRMGERLGLALQTREELYGDQWSPLIPAAFAEYIVSQKGQVVVKASAARNYRYPTLNDLYFMPGGNPDLKPEKGFTYDFGVESGLRTRRMELKGEATVYDSQIDDWILWLPTSKGFWSPTNVKRVHSYGLELKGKARLEIGDSWWVYADANYTVSRARNNGDPVSWGDNSGGKQLVYIPEYSNAATLKLGWKTWTFTYQYNYYSRRFTTSSNETETRIGLLGAYYMNDLALEKSLSFDWGRVNLKGAVNNLFNEEYESVLSRPMTGRNFGIFIEITPKFRKQQPH